MQHPCYRTYFGLFATFVCLALGPAQGVSAQMPALNIEITAEHPAFIFWYPPCSGEEAAFAAGVRAAYEVLPEDLRPYALMGLDAGAAGADSRHARYQAMLGPLQAAEIPVVVRIADADWANHHKVEDLDALLAGYTVVRGVEITGLPFNIYADGGPGTGPVEAMAAWIAEVIDVAARYGRFVHMPLAEVAWPRIMSNVSCAPLCAKLRERADYVVPSCLHRGHHNIARMSALLGLWLEEAVTAWGVAPDSRWYTDAWFVKPGVSGQPDDATGVPSTLYRAMLLNGAMCGATVYAFPNSADLWFGDASRHWEASILPTLRQLVASGLVARRDFVERRVRVAYQLAPAANALDFHLNLRDIDGVADAGLLVRGAYGLPEPGQNPELILDHGGFFWIPVLSAHAEARALGKFQAVVQPGQMQAPRDWRALLEQHYGVPAQSEAFVASVGRGIFVMNTRENTPGPQRFRIEEAPAPVRGIVARREAESVELTWPFREGDVSYQVYRRIVPQVEWTRIADGVEGRRYLDENVNPDQTVAYSVTALTGEAEPFEGTVAYGEYLALSMVQSRIAEQVQLSPLLSYAESMVMAPDAAGMEEEALLEPVAPDQAAPEETAVVPEPEETDAAEAIEERIALWGEAFAAADLDGVLDVYDTEYEDPQGWRFQYVRRAYQWFFERYAAHHFHHQVRQWDFGVLAQRGEVNVLLYCRLTGYAITGAAGRVADLPVSIPRTRTAEVWVTWAVREGVWRIIRTNPGVPNFRDLLSYSAGPYAGFTPGPDVYAPAPPSLP